jgi:dihydrofolate synthase/folylpolyglutamate synthase
MSALSRLLELPRFADQGAAAYRPGLERMRALLEEMGHPERSYPVLHVGGTNGKGSTASMAAAILTAAGMRVGLHTSPHLLHLGERMRIDGRPASESWLVDAAERYEPVFDDIGTSFFEATTALAFAHFADGDVDMAVVEVGLGGRLDATNVLSPLATAVTNVGLDHTELLGDTIQEIATEKAGIARPNVPFFTAASGGGLAALRAACEPVGATFEDVHDTVELGDLGDGTFALRTSARGYGPVRIGFPGAHQGWNAAVALRLAETAMPDLPVDAVRTGLADVARLSGLRGRGENLPGDARILLDVAHNADGWQAALAAVERAPAGRLFVLAGVMADKDAGALGQAIARAGATALPVALPSPRALDRGALAAALRAAGAAVAEFGGSAAHVLDWFRRHAGTADRLLVTGSHVTVAEVLRIADAG